MPKTNMLYKIFDFFDVPKRLSTFTFQIPNEMWNKLPINITPIIKSINMI